MRLYFCRCLLLLLCSGSLFAAIESYEFENDEQRARYQQLSAELRCPKCQNQNLADSDSQIAADLRRALHSQLLDGKSDEDIVAFMTERYGDFVLYKPRLQLNTLVLWIGPFVLLCLVFFMLWWTRRTSQQVEVTSGSLTVSIDTDQSAAIRTGLSANRWINIISLIVLLAVALGSLWLYRQLGAMDALEMTEAGHAVFSGQLPPEQLALQQEALLEQLDAWLARHPQDEKFLYMRARLLSEAGMWEKALQDYRDLVSRFPEQDNLLAEYAQVLYLQAGRTMTADATAFLQQALAVNPHNVTALGLLGMHAFEQQDYTLAVKLWQRLLRVIPPGTPQAETIAAGMARARELGNIAPVAVAGDIRLTVQVSMSPAMHAQPEETVFVLLRAVDGPRMPLAAVRTTVAALTMPVQLDTSTSPMRGQLDMAAIKSFEVVARLSRSGQAIPAVGDWEGISQPLVAGSIPENVLLVIEREVLP